MGTKRFAEGSVSGRVDRMQAAAVRAIDAHMSMSRQADHVVDELDQITAPGVIRQQLTDEDSLVIAINAITSGA
jgi:hypothetical protein